jgi:hypothetical protein
VKMKGLSFSRCRPANWIAQDGGGIHRQNCVDLALHARRTAADRRVGPRKGESMPEAIEPMRSAIGANRFAANLIRVETQKRPTRQR